MTFGVTPSGFKTKTFADSKADIEESIVAQFGDANLEPQSIFGQFTAFEAKKDADIWDNLEDLYFSSYPSTAEGVSLDYIVALNGLKRLDQQQTRVFASCYGTENTVIYQNSLAKLDNGQLFYAAEGGTISKSSADTTKILVSELAADAYSFVVNGKLVIYGLTKIAFDANFVADNEISVQVNGRRLVTVPFATDQATTGTALANQLKLQNPPIANAVYNNAERSITITPTVGYSAVVNNVLITGGASQPGYSLSYVSPASVSAVSAALVAIVNQSSDSLGVIATQDGSSLFLIASPESPFSFSLNAHLSMTQISSPLLFLAQNYGAIAAPISSLTTIVNPIPGWDSITNREAGATGREIETDAELRARRQKSISLLGASSVEAIKSRLIQDVPGVTNALVFENDTSTKEPFLIVLDAQLVSGNIISLSLNGGAEVFAVSFTTNHLTTMEQVQEFFEGLTEVVVCDIGGINNQTLTVNFKPWSEMTIDFFTISGANAPNVIVKGGRPMRSFEAVVTGGTNADIANELWQIKPAGIQTYGNQQFNITDSQGDQHAIFFSRSTDIYIWVDVVLHLYDEEIFPSDGIEQVRAAILSYGQTLSIGADVLTQRVLAQIFQVEGIASGDVQIAYTPGANDTPNYSAANISIAETEAPMFALERINVTVA